LEIRTTAANIDVKLDAQGFTVIAAFMEHAVAAAAAGISAILALFIGLTLVGHDRCRDIARFLECT
jgi:hypothetical protein